MFGRGSCRTDPANYRPISIIPVLARVCEKIAAGQLYEYCDRRSVIPPEQCGFRRQSSCEMALLYAIGEWIASIDAGKMVGALPIDLSKAFDCAPHQLLIREVASSGCGMQVQHWFTSYLDQRVQRVVQKGKVTEWRQVGRGVPQGSCLSPLLFNVFVRNLPSANQLATIQFADDVTDYVAESDPIVLAQKLTEGFNETKNFCEEHELKINTGKTKLILFKHRTHSYRITLS